MTSSFGWLDFSDADRRVALEVIDLFREKGTVDELGIGTVRDAIANLLFPGTSTIMTRARYYLFIAWIYQRHEGRKTPSNEIAQRARRDEIQLIEALIAGGESRGVIGIDARAKLKRIPSTVYWQGMGVLGIRRYPGSMDSYHRSLDRSYRREDSVLRGDHNEIVAGGPSVNWDPHLPDVPGDMLKNSTLQLTRHEAQYLRECWIQAAPHSLMSFLVDREADGGDAEYPWEHDLYNQFPAALQQQVRHAREFSQVMHGAALLYNLMLAEKSANPEWVDGYRDRFGEWVGAVTGRMDELQRWDRQHFWGMVDGTGVGIPGGTRLFVDTWLDLALTGEPARLRQLASARTLLSHRERSLKGKLARLQNQRALDLWQGASFARPLEYRWSRPVRDILHDIRLGLQGT